MMMPGEAGKVPENGYYLRKPLHFRKEGKIIKRQLELSELGEASLWRILSSCAESCLDIHSHWGWDAGVKSCFTVHAPWLRLPSEHNSSFLSVENLILQPVLSVSKAVCYFAVWVAVSLTTMTSRSQRGKEVIIHARERTKLSSANLMFDFRGARVSGRSISGRFVGTNEDWVECSHFYPYMLYNFIYIGFQQIGTSLTAQKVASA